MAFLCQGTPTALEVKARQKLKGNPNAWNQLVDHLSGLFEKQMAAGVKVVISDCDLSQNHITRDQLEQLLTLIDVGDVRVLRWRLFGIPTMDDDALGVFADYFGRLKPELAPMEVHLSDCAITDDGFMMLMTNLKGSEAFPVKGQFGTSKMPLYMRLENNYIDEALMKSEIDEGSIRVFTKAAGGSTRRQPADDSVKVDLVVGTEYASSGSFRQKKGSPPPPDQAPPPKQVHDRAAQDLQAKAQNAAASWWGGGMGGAAGWGGGWGAGNAAAGNAAAGAWNGAAAGAWNGGGGWGGWGSNTAATATPSKPSAWAPAVSAWAAPAPRPHSGAGSLPGKPQAAATSNFKPTWNSPTAGAPRPMGTVGSAPRIGMANAGAASRPQGPQAVNIYDRSRSPAPMFARNQQQQVVGGKAQAAGAKAAGGKGVGLRPVMSAPAPPKPAAKAKIPLPWEEQWSDEYGIPYYWNSETGEAIWEKMPGWP